MIPLRVPDASVLVPYLRRAFGLWLIIRIAIVVLAAMSPAFDEISLLHWHLPGALGSIAACAILGIIDTRRRGERALLANLGVTDRELILMFVASAVMGELVLALFFAS